jgi:hypothetical protein
MRKTDIPASLVALAWAYLLMAGIGGLRGIKSQHVPGYPVPSQLVLYAGVPVASVLSV